MSKICEIKQKIIDAEFQLNSQKCQLEYGRNKDMPYVLKAYRRDPITNGKMLNRLIGELKSNQKRIEELHSEIRSLKSDLWDAKREAGVRSGSSEDTE